MAEGGKGSEGEGGRGQGSGEGVVGGRGQSTNRDIRPSGRADLLVFRADKSALFVRFSVTEFRNTVELLRKRLNEIRPFSAPRFFNPSVAKSPLQMLRFRIERPHNTARLHEKMCKK